MAFAESSDIAGIPDSAVSMPTHLLCKIAYLRITQPVTRQERSQVLRMRSQRGFRVYNGILIIRTNFEFHARDHAQSL